MWKLTDFFLEKVQLDMGSLKLDVQLITFWFNIHVLCESRSYFMVSVHKTRPLFLETLVQFTQRVIFLSQNVRISPFTGSMASRDRLETEKFNVQLGVISLFRRQIYGP